MMRYLLYICFLFFLSCQQEDLLQSHSPGFLSLENVTVAASDVNSIQTKAGVDARFVIEIWKGGALYNDCKYEPGEISGKIELPAGSYLLKAYTSNYTSQETVFADGNLGEAIYYKEQAFAIEAEKVTYPAVSVPMINFGISLKDDLPTSFSDYTLDATIGDRTITLKPAETGYFPVSAIGGSLTFTLKATNADGEKLDTKETASNLRAGTIYEIVYSMATKSLDCETLNKN
ncbi:DUF4493 domain-containing protein [Parabacteroides sp.]